MESLIEFRENLVACTLEILGPVVGSWLLGK